MAPYLNVHLQSYNLKGHTEIHVKQYDTIVKNEDEWVEALTQAVYSKRFKLSAKGSTTAHLGALKADLTIDKDVPLDGECSEIFISQDSHTLQVWTSSVGLTSTLPGFCSRLKRMARIFAARPFSRTTRW